jgi:hypothetical protein
MSSSSSLTAPFGVIRLMLSGCATLDELAVGRADRLAEAPFIIEYRSSGPATNHGVVLLSSVELDDPRNREDWPAGRAAAFEPLQLAIDAFLAEQACCARAAPRGLPVQGAPYLYLGSAQSDATPEPAATERLLGAEYPAMVLYLEKPSAAWRARLTEILGRAGAKYLVWLQIGIAEYPKADRGAFGKQVHLGTGHSEPIALLSAVDKPVEVVQVVGVLLDAAGNAVRAGGEGFFASDTLFRYQMFDVTRTIDHDQIADLVAEHRREDLPGRPLAWQVAVQNLIAGLLDAPLDRAPLPPAGAGQSDGS